VDLPAARSTRRDLLGWASDNTALVLPAHFSGRSALEVVRNGGAFAIKGWRRSRPTRCEGGVL
jgi:hypothetical protein